MNSEINYCNNDNCDDYSVENKEYCKICLEDNAIDILEPFIKGTLVRQNMKKKWSAINRLYSYIKMLSVKKTLHIGEIINTVNITEDTNIVKHILKEGNGICPNDGQLITVHYTGRLTNGIKFDSSYDRNEPFEFQLGTENIIPLWNIGLKTMSKGEKALLVGSPDYCYKNQNIPGIPANSSLIFEIEVIDFRDKPKEIFEMDKEEREMHMVEYKTNAKELYENNKLQDALDNYKKAYDYLLDDTHSDKILLLSNLSIINGKILDWKQSLHYATLASEIDNKNIKILYRIALAHFNINNYQECIDTCNNILAIDETNSITKNLLKKSILNKKIELDKNKKIYKKMFA